MFGEMPMGYSVFHNGFLLSAFFLADGVLGGEIYENVRASSDL